MEKNLEKTRIPAKKTQTLYEIQFKGFMIRNRITRVEKDEKPSKSFLKFGKTARANSTIVHLKI